MGVVKLVVLAFIVSKIFFVHTAAQTESLTDMIEQYSIYFKESEMPTSICYMHCNKHNIKSQIIITMEENGGFGYKFKLQIN